MSVTVVVSELGYLRTHRIPYLRALAARGCAVTVVAPEEGPLPELPDIAIRHWSLRRWSVGPIGELASVLALRRLVDETDPDVLVTVALKPTVYGALALAGRRRRIQVAMIAGLGTSFADAAGRLRMRLQRGVVRTGLRLAARRARARFIVQTEADAAVVRALVGRAAVDIRVVPGVGADLARFRPSRPPSAVSPPVIAFAGRLLRSKGVDVFIEAAKRIAREHPGVRGVIAGKVVAGHPDALDPAILTASVAGGVVEYVGEVTDMPAFLDAATVLCLPTTYGEGVPKILLEAHAAGRPCVASAAPGCAWAIDDGRTGILLPTASADAAAAAMLALLRDPARLDAMGQAARARAEAEFDDQRRAHQMVEVTLDPATVGE